MSTTVQFLILYLIPILSVAGTFGTYALGYGKKADDLVMFSFMFIGAGLIASCYLTVTLITQFLTDEVSYLGIAFSIVGCLLELIAFAFYILIFKDELG